MPNPFYIQPASPQIGLQNLLGAVTERAGFERERAKETGKIKKREEAMKMYKTGTEEEITNYFAKDPQALQEVESVISSINERTKQDKKDKAWEIVRGEKEPLIALTEHAEVIHAEGGNATETIQAAHTAATDPQAIKDASRKYLAMVDGKALMDYDKALADPADPTIKEPTAKIQQWNEYNRLKKIDPAQATLFASSVGIDEAPEAAAFNFTDDEKDRMAAEFTQSGEYPLKGRSKEVIRLQAEIKKRSLEQQKARGVADISALYNRLDKKGMQKDIDGQQVKLGSMRSFIGNIDKQAAKIEEVGARMKRFDTKFLNIPLNKVIDAVGDADRATFRLLIGELSEEIGKLASGATNSVAALTEGGREKWDKIFDTNLSYADMMELVKESKEIAHMRVDSMKESLKESRKIIRKTPRSKQAAPIYNEGDTANGGKLIFSGGVWKDNV